MIDQFNKGSAPSPYEKVGFGGMKIEPVIIDENGGATKQVQELRNLYQRDNVDAVIGYISSGDCLAVAPIAEELKKMLVLYGLRHAAHLRGSASTIRVPHRRACHDG